MRRWVSLVGLALCVGGALSAQCGVGRAAAADGAPTILVSRQLLEAQTLAIGDDVLLSSDPSGSNARRFRIADAYEPTPDPMQLGAARLEARLHLPDLLALTADPSDPQAAESVAAINVALVDPTDAPAFARDLSTKAPGLVARATAGAEDVRPFVVLERFHLAIALVTVIASTVFLLALMVMLVEERRETVGILRLIGFRKRRILLQVFAEGLLIAVAGTLFGILFAVAWQGAINRFFQWRYDTALVFVRITPQIAWECVLRAIPLGTLASVAASWTLLRREVLSLARR